MIKNKNLMQIAKDLFPINRSLTGIGVRKTLRYIKKIHPNLIIRSVPSGKKVFDWKTPLEWKISDGYIKDEKNNKILNYKSNNLQIMSYSTYINKKIAFEDLKKKIYTIKKKPNTIPYVFSFYNRDWGFCMKYNDFKKLDKKQKYKVFIKSKLFKGKMNYGEYTIKGKSKKEILIVSYICHPSLANNELSGPLVLIDLIKKLKEIKDNKYTIKIIFIPETIGAIYYINKNLDKIKKNMILGINITCVGKGKSFNLINSINKNTYADYICERVLKKNYKYKKNSFLKRGSNERQFGCQNLNLPFVTICRDIFGNYKEYHTSDDNLSIISEKNLKKTSELILKIIYEAEKNEIYIKNKICEPFLSKYDLIYKISTRENIKNSIKKDMLNLISYVGKNYDLLELSKILSISPKKIKKIATNLLDLKIINTYI